MCRAVRPHAPVDGSDKGRRMGWSGRLGPALDHGRRTIRKGRPLQRQGAAGKTRPPGAAAIGVANAADTTYLEIPGFSRRKIALGPLLAHEAADTLNSS